ncbi:phospholipase D-like domain-containing protein [Oscillatoria sp. CS-180]|uniref:phospholipase D-like domain-containing protein n=1 Tax=Oscillatoria sp. CS-180 TaxID=3021720 RepID=UPI00232A8146|nr:phospholipase D-like domain-containing protein [Oscillatoria sp. CS-180]MDB9526369.1 phospholipase D-like domain-containing protein [Oscillatoria sp. CS-180]
MVRQKGQWIAIAVIGVVLALSFHHWLVGSAQLSLAHPLLQDPYIQVYFNQSRANAYSDPYRRIQRHGDDLEQVIVAAIATATTSIDVAVQEINLPRIAVALRDRARSGVTVRVIVENQYNRVWRPLADFQSAPLDDYQQAKHSERQQLIDANRDGRITAQELDQGDAIRILQKADVPLLDDTADGSKGSGLMHHKFMVVDGRTVLLGSANWTLSGIHGDFAHKESRGNANALLKIDSPELAAVLEDEFEMMWGDGPQGKEDSLFGLQKPLRSPRTISLPGAQITVQFSPVSESKPWEQSVNGLISQMLAQGTSSIDLALFVFSDQGISDRLAQKSQAGVAVRALVDRNFIYRSYSEALDMLGTAVPDHRCKYEANNRPWTVPISQVGTPNLPEGDKLHHKFALIDDYTVIIGSHNWSAAANHNNDEDLLIIRNPTVAAHFRREFDRLAEHADMGLTKSLQNYVQRQRKRCGGGQS